MNIKRLCKVAYIKQESSWASRYYLSILYWLYMPVYSSKKKPKQPKLVTLATWLCYLQTSKSNSQDTQTVGEVNLYHCRCIIWSAYFMATFLCCIHLSFLVVFSSFNSSQLCASIDCKMFNKSYFLFFTF